jgi:hypothetical protein
MSDKVKFTPARAQDAAEELERLIGAVICRRRMQAEGEDDEILGIQDQIILDDLDAAVAAWTDEESAWFDEIER